MVVERTLSQIASVNGPFTLLFFVLLIIKLENIFSIPTQILFITMICIEIAVLNYIISSIKHFAPGNKRIVLFGYSSIIISTVLLFFRIMHTEFLIPSPEYLNTAFNEKREVIVNDGNASANFFVFYFSFIKIWGKEVYIAISNRSILLNLKFFIRFLIVLPFKILKTVRQKFFMMIHFFKTLLRKLIFFPSKHFIYAFVIFSLLHIILFPLFYHIRIFSLAFI
jgi:hypothetical protein